MSIGNVILILTDQQHYRSLGSTGSQIARTPNLDSLALSGINFEKHIVTNPVCMPSRASIQTGQYINQHGVWCNGCTLKRDAVTIPKVLAQAGVDSAHFGKLHLEPIVNRVAASHAYGYQTCEISEGDQWLTTDSYFSWLRTQHPDTFLQYVGEMFQNGQSKGYCSTLPEDLHLTHFVTDQAIDWLRTRRRAEQPFFLSIGYFDPHHAFNPVEPYFSHFKDADVPEPLFREGDIEKKPEHYAACFREKQGVTRNPEAIRDTIRAYHAMVEHVDANIGRLMDTLKALKLHEDTLILFSSDHGELLGNHGLLHKGPFLLDDLAHVPMIASIPDGRLRNGSCTEYTSGIDFMATIARVMGVPAPESPGLPMLDAKLHTLPDGARGYALCEWEGAYGGTDLSLRCIQNDEYKLVSYGNDTEGELYDLQSDPHEFNNLYSERSHRKPLDAMLSLLSTCYTAPRPNSQRRAPW